MLQEFQSVLHAEVAFESSHWLKTVPVQNLYEAVRGVSNMERRFARKSVLVDHLRSHQEKPDDSNAVGTEDADVMPDREISNSAPTPTTKGLGKRKLNRRRIVSADEDFEVEEPPVVKFQEDENPPNSQVK